MDSLRFSRERVAFLIGVPLFCAVLLLFHPLGGGDVYDDLGDAITRWQGGPRRHAVLHRPHGAGGLRTLSATCRARPPA
jgi:hypothetical protein